MSVPDIIMPMAAAMTMTIITAARTIITATTTIIITTMITAIRMITRTTAIATTLSDDRENRAASRSQDAAKTGRRASSGTPVAGAAQDRRGYRCVAGGTLRRGVLVSSHGVAVAGVSGRGVRLFQRHRMGG